jgi:hypothetical protein
MAEKLGIIHFIFSCDFCQSILNYFILYRKTGYFETIFNFAIKSYEDGLSSKPAKCTYHLMAIPTFKWLLNERIGFGHLLWKKKQLKIFNLISGFQMNSGHLHCFDKKYDKTTFLHLNSLWFGFSIWFILHMIPTKSSKWKKSLKWPELPCFTIF